MKGDKLLGLLFMGGAAVAVYFLLTKKAEAATPPKALTAKDRYVWATDAMGKKVCRDLTLKKNVDSVICEAYHELEGY